MTADQDLELQRALSSTYQLLSWIFKQEPSSNLLCRTRSPGILSIANELDLHPLQGLEKDSPRHMLERLRDEFNHLFIIPGDRFVSPYESVHREGRLMGESAMEVSNEYRRSGLEISASTGLLPDHISLQLEYMSILLIREIEKPEDGKPHQQEGAQTRKLRLAFLRERLGSWISVFRKTTEKRATSVNAKRLRQMFLQEHLGCWISCFCKTTQKRATMAFYPEFARLAARLIEYDLRYSF